MLEHLHATGATIVAETLGGEYITATAPIIVWEKMFKCEFFMFHQTQEDDVIKKVVRTESYSIPAILNDHVDSVFNTVEMPHRNVIWGRLEKAKGTREDEKSILGVTSFTTPPKLRSAYNMGTSKGSNSATQGVFESLGKYYSPADLLKFQSEFGIDPQTVSTVIGGHESSSVCSEDPRTCSQPNLDVQYIMAASPVSPTTFLYTDLDNFSQWIMLVANTAKPSLVYSIGYGVEEVYIANSERLAFETQAIKLGAMGVTIVAGSGNNGAISKSAGAACRYAPLFPASSPYVTTVGATMVSLRVW